MNLALIADSADYWPILWLAIKTGRVSGPLIQNARIAVMCLHQRINRLWTADLDFSLFQSRLLEIY